MLALRLVFQHHSQSPSPRRAWIEISRPNRDDDWCTCRPPHGGRGLKYLIHCARLECISRPPHGGRGLKYVPDPVYVFCYRSPSPRRAWIEISTMSTKFAPWIVALPTEGVD